MKATLTLDPDVAQLVRDTVEREHISVRDAINEGLRKGLKASRALGIVPHSGVLRPGIDPRGFNQLADEFENESVLSKSKS
jgi:hypothetical protein